jgi:WD40 repeat protein
VNTLAFAADASVWLTDSESEDEPATLWDSQKGDRIRRLRGKQSSEQAAELSGDGHWAITGGYNGTVCLWNTQTGSAVAIFPRPDLGPVQSAAAGGTAKLVPILVDLLKAHEAPIRIGAAALLQDIDPAAAAKAGVR